MSDAVKERRNEKGRGREKEGGRVLGSACLICFLCRGPSASKHKYSRERSRRPHCHSYKPPERHIAAQCGHFLWKKNSETFTYLHPDQSFQSLCFDVRHRHQVYQQNNHPQMPLARSRELTHFLPAVNLEGHQLHTYACPPFIC